MKILVSFVAFLYQAGYVSDKQLVLKHYIDLDSQAQKKLLEKNQVLLNDDIERFYQQWSSLKQTDLSLFDPKIAAQLPEPFARRYKAIVITKTDSSLIVGLTNPLDTKATQAISLVLKEPVIFLLALQDSIYPAIDKLYRQTAKTLKLAALAKQKAEVQVALSAKNVELTKLEEQSDVQKTLDSILHDALNLESSDIHIEADEQKIIVRYRVSGTMIEQLRLPIEIKNVLLRHVLVRSDGDLGELRLPQDTSFQINHYGDLINIRVSVLNSINGYSIVLRLLMPAEKYTHLDKLVKNKEFYKDLEDYMNGINGMCIITGPTSSGKTTLLYSMLMKLKDNDLKILTAEDPVEALLPGIIQTQVEPEINLDYSLVIQTSLRQNPDCLMIGEIRNAYSAQMSVRAAITGVMVLTTLHTKNSSSAVLRLRDLDVDQSLIASGLKLVIACRLARLLCLSCRQASIINEQQNSLIIEKLYQGEGSFIGDTCYEAVGCEDCNFTGYRGLHGIYEYFKFNYPMIEALNQDDTKQFTKLVFKQIAGKTLAHQVCNLWLAGQTSYSEITKLMFSL